MSSKRYTEEFKIEAVKQVTECGHGIYSVASRLGITHTSLYAWIRRYGDQPALQETITDHQAEINRLKAELKRVTEERDILKKATAYFAKESM
jgi:transposase-like protein